MYVLITDSCVLSLSTDACCQVITLGMQRDILDICEAALHRPSALAYILVVTDVNISEFVSYNNKELASLTHLSNLYSKQYTSQQ